jgi:Mrp family chromosome partitioning ATPase
LSKIYDALQKRQREPQSAPPEELKPPRDPSPPQEPPTAPPPVAEDPDPGDEAPKPARKLALPALGDYPDHYWDAVARVGSSIQVVEAAQGKAILITGVQKGTGVSTIALGVASYLVRDPGVSVLLIDAHARPDRGALLPAGSVGLIQLGREKVAIRDVITDTDRRGLSYIPRGNGSYNGPKLVEALAPSLPKLRSRFDYLIFDSAPAIGAPETAVLAGHCDGVIVVLDAERTPKTEALRTRTVLTQHDAIVIGTVVNRVRRTSLFGTR